jgi:signal transduction histidine kinase
MNSARHFSLTRRIIASVIGAQLLLIIGLTAAALLYGRAELRKAFDDTLDGRAMSTLALVRYSEDHPPVLTFDSELLPPSSNPNHKDLFEIRLANGRALAQSGSPPVIPGESGQRYMNFEVGGVPYRAVMLQDVQVLDTEEDVKVPDRVTVLYAASLLPVQENLAQLGASVAGAGLLLLLLASALVTWGVRRRLEPLRELAEQAGAISLQNWNFHPPGEAKMASELVPLTGAIETLLDRLHAAFRQQSDFTSNIAHELKTSTAILKSAIQSLLHRPRSEQEYAAGLDLLLQDCTRLEDLLARMLRLARLEQWTATGARDRLPLTEVRSTCESAISRIQALARERELEVELVSTGPETVYVRAEPEDLEVIWINLLENAVLHSPPGTKILVRIQQNSPEAAQVSVEDSGPGIPPEELPHVFERFRRGDRSRTRAAGGFGLGLAICKAFVTAYGGAIEAVPRPTQGTEMRVELPTEPA